MESFKRLSMVCALKVDKYALGGVFVCFLGLFVCLLLTEHS